MAGRDVVRYAYSLSSIPRRPNRQALNLLDGSPSCLVQQNAMLLGYDRITGLEIILSQ